MQTTVEQQADPRQPGRTAYRITGPSRDAVQVEIDRLSSDVDAATGGALGMAQFFGPAPVDKNVWGAVGHVIVREVA